MPVPVSCGKGDLPEMGVQTSRVHAPLPVPLPKPRRQQTAGANRHRAQSGCINSTDRTV